MLEYCLLDSIYKLSKSDKAHYKGWCSASRSHFLYLASEATIKRTLIKLSKGDNPWIEYKDSKRLLKKTTTRYYNEVMCYLDGTATFVSGQNDPEVRVKVKSSRVKVTQEEGQNDPEVRVKVTPNNNKDNNSNNNKDKKAVSVPPTFEQRQQERYLDTFKANYQALDVPKSFNEKTRDLLKKFLWLSFQSRPSEFAKLNRQQMTVKQFYTILVQEQRSYAFLEALCINAVNNNWKNLNSEWLKDFKEPFVYVRPVN